MSEIILVGEAWEEIAKEPLWANLTKGRLQGHVDLWILVVSRCQLLSRHIAFLIYISRSSWRQYRKLEGILDPGTPK